VFGIFLFNQSAFYSIAQITFILGFEEAVKSPSAFGSRISKDLPINIIR
jgi:hypothetical protein